MEDALLVISTFPDVDTAKTAAHVLVGERLAACVNLLLNVVSVYTWEGQRTEGHEVMALVKTTRRAYPALAERLRGLHPYEVPEIIALTPHDGLPAYLRWIDANVGPAPRPPGEVAG